MDAFNFSDMRTENQSSMPGHNLFSGIAKTLRIVELFLALLLLSWILTRLPLALRLSAECLRNPLFVFALSNAIIAALLAQSSRFSAESSPPAPPRLAPVEEKAEQRHDHTADRAETDTCTEKGSAAVTDFESRRVYRRCRSEKLEGEGEDGRKKKLRRSETEVTPRGSKYAHDKLSNEEFRRTIEAFIAKQMRLLREESLAIIVQTSSEQTNNLMSNH